MAHTKAKGTTKGNRDSQPKYLGVKLHDGQKAITGNIIIRQRGSKYWAGEGVKLGSDDTIFAMKEGVVKFTTRKKKNYDGNSRIIKVVNVI
ncbi:MAG: 50S ribosomal protein L27 [bacterium]|nr:50S ribosomal protein L27 [bacterium]